MDSHSHPGKAWCCFWRKEEGCWPDQNNSLLLWAPVCFWVHSRHLIKFHVPFPPQASPQSLPQWQNSACWAPTTRLSHWSVSLLGRISALRPMLPASRCLWFSILTKRAHFPATDSVSWTLCSGLWLANRMSHLVPLTGSPRAGTGGYVASLPLLQVASVPSLAEFLRCAQSLFRLEQGAGVWHLGRCQLQFCQPTVAILETDL